MLDAGRKSARFNQVRQGRLRAHSAILSTALGAAALLAGCGGDGKTTTATAEKATTDAGAPSLAQKEVDDSIQRFGAMGSRSQLAQATATLHAYLRARAAGRWSRACQLMAAIPPPSEGAATPPSCPRLVAALSAGIPQAARRRLAVARVSALRVHGERGFVLYRGAEDAAYFMPMVHEDGRWKVGAIAASALPAQ